MIKHYSRLFRLPNLLLIVLTQYLLRYYIFMPKVGKLAISNIDFFLMVLMTVFIAAAGNIINDYFDMRSDRINKPDKMVLGKHINRRWAIILHWTFNSLGVIIGFYLAWKVNCLRLGLVVVAITIMLWLYSTRYKKKFLIGNIIIALMVSFSIFIPWLYEFFALVNVRDIFVIKFIQIGKTYVLAYIYFAFIITLLREIVKDIIDIKGDSVVGCNTIPISLGINKTKKLLIVLVGITILSMIYFQSILFTFEYNLIFWYTIITISLPCIYLIFAIIKASKKEDYQWFSSLVKVVLFAGILSMQLFSILSGSLESFL